MKVIVLGSGTSSGVPLIGCTCANCNSKDPKDTRTRASIYIDLGTDHTIRHILIDSGPDFRTQAIINQIPRVDLVLYTHSHADHIFGLDDLRIYNFIQQTEIPIYADDQTANDLLRIFKYCFEKDPDYEGGGIPSLILNKIRANKEFYLNNNSLKILPVEIFHGKKSILGYRINNFAYLTDCSFVPQKSLELLDGIEVIVLSGLRNRPHKTHFTILEAVNFAKTTSASKVFLTHLSHDVNHLKQSEILEAYSKEDKRQTYLLCYDGLRIDL